MLCSTLKAPFTSIYNNLHIFTSQNTIYFSDPRRHEIAMRPFSAKPGVMVNFESPIYIKGRFTGFDGWNMTNDKFRATNISYIVRVEFANQGSRK